jgi:lysozyme
MVKPTIDDQTCIQRLMVNEGCVLKSYKDSVGKLTIGIGRNLDDNPLSEEELCYVGHNCRTKFISNDQAAYLCRNDLKKVRADLDRELPWWRDLCFDRQYVMIDLCFNLGIRTLLTFKRTLESIASGFYIRAAEQLLQSKYAKQVGVRADRNAYALKTGVYLIKLPKELI